MPSRRNSTYTHELKTPAESVADMDFYDNDVRLSNMHFVSWSYENEEILVEWGDIAQSYRWLHRESYMAYLYEHAWFTIPIIILSTSVGAISFLRTSGAGSGNEIRPSLFVTGGVNIFIGILATVQEYLKVSQLQEAHRLAYVNWDKFARNIRIELSKAPNERMDAHHFIKLSRINFDGMMETSPLIDAAIVQRFISTFEGKEGTPERKAFNNLKKPDICRSIVSINDTRKQWFEKDVVFPTPTEVVRAPRRRVSMRNNNLVTIINSNKNLNPNLNPSQNFNNAYIQNMEYNRRFPTNTPGLFSEPPSRTSVVDTNENIIAEGYNDDDISGNMVGIKYNDMLSSKVENLHIPIREDEIPKPNNDTIGRRISNYDINEMMGNHQESPRKLSVSIDNRDQIIDYWQDASNMNSSFRNR